MSCRQVCCYGMSTDISACRSQTGTDISACRSRTGGCCGQVPSRMINCGNGIKRTYRDCVNLEPWVKEFWFVTSGFLLIVGMIFLCTVGLIMAITEISMIPMLLSLAAIGLGIIPWIVYGIYLLVGRVKTCYRRYQKQYHEYNRVQDPHDPENPTNSLLGDDTLTMTMSDDTLGDDTLGDDTLGDDTSDNSDDDYN